jgi:predicted HTH transcriptional regulator
MTSIQKILSQGEGLTVEFKRAKGQLPSSLFETVCAFLNRSGGILLGVGDDKSIEGVDPDKAETLCKNIANLSNNLQKLFPAFLLTAKKMEFRSKTLIHLFVPISSQVHRCNNKIFDRSEDGDFELKTDEQIKQLYNRKSIKFMHSYAGTIWTDTMTGKTSGATLSRLMTGLRVLLQSIFLTNSILKVISGYHCARRSFVR